MNSNTWYVVVGLFLLQLVATVIITNRLNRKMAERDKRQEEIEKARVEYENVVLDMSNANAKLSYALAMAIKRGSPNGEVEAGITAYSEAMSKKDKFLQEQAIYRIAS